MKSGIECPHALSEKYNEARGKWFICCALVMAAVLPGVLIHQDRCARCSQRDDGASPASESILYHLRQRISDHWSYPVETTEKGQASACGIHYQVSVTGALEELMRRKRSEAAIAAVDKSSMPAEIKDSLKEMVNDAADRRENP